VNKDLLCSAFCQELETHVTPAGIAVKTGFSFVDGDPVGFYITRHPSGDETFRIEDSGMLVPFIEASGVNIKRGARAEMFVTILNEYGASYDADSAELQTGYMPASDIPAASLKFVALLLRLQDLKQWTQENVESTFKEDAKREIRKAFGERATVGFDAPPTDRLKDSVADAVIRAEGHAPVAVFFGTSESRLNEAVITKLEAKEEQISCRVVLLLESNRHPQNVSDRVYTRAVNRTDAVAYFRGDEAAAMRRIGDLVFPAATTMQ
jgi:hypothetical protein